MSTEHSATSTELYATSTEPYATADQISRACQRGAFQGADTDRNFVEKVEGFSRLARVLEQLDHHHHPSPAAHAGEQEEKEEVRGANTAVVRQQRRTPDTRSNSPAHT
ncbi:MAG: hypothetical protein ACJ0RG_11255 [Candidatus Azotimanducaceae bacterium]